jgi:RinA family phage transcriptional activator
LKIDRRVFKYIEYELYNYEQTKRDLALYKEQVLEGTSKPEVAVQSGLSDPTASKAIKLMSSAFVMHAERVINAIDKSLAMLGEQYKRLFELKYIKCMPWQRIIYEMYISEGTYYRLRREIVTTVGQKLGLVNIE